MSISGEYNGKHPTVYQDDTEAYGEVDDPGCFKPLTLMLLTPWGKMPKLTPST